MGPTKPIELTSKDRKRLEAVLARPTSPAGFARRAQVILLSADGISGAEIARRLGLSPEHVCRVRARFAETGVEGLADRKKAGRKDHAVPQATVERIVQLAMSPPPAGRNRWTTRLLAREVGHTSGTVSKILKANGLKPHLSRTYKVSRDPEFARKGSRRGGVVPEPAG
jgi:transposase